MAAKKMVSKKTKAKALTSAQAKLALKAMGGKGKMPMPMAKKMSAKFTPPGFDAEDAIDHGVDEATEKN